MPFSLLPAGQQPKLISLKLSAIAAVVPTEMAVCKTCLSNIEESVQPDLLFKIRLVLSIVDEVKCRSEQSLSAVRLP